MTEDCYDQIVAGFYGAATGQQDWRSALDRLAEGLNLEAAQVFATDITNFTPMFSFDGGPVDPGAFFDYARHYYAVNPANSAFVRLPVGEWMRCHEHFDDAYVAQSPYFQDFLVPYNLRYFIQAKLIQTEHTLVAFGMFRAINSSPFTDMELVLLDRIKLHLTNSITMYMHLRTTYAESGSAKHMLHQFRHPMVLVDANRSIWFSNGAGREVLDEGDYILDRDGLLGCFRTEDSQRLLFALKELDLQTVQRGAAITGKHLLKIRKIDGAPVAVYVSAIRPEKVMNAFGHLPLAMLVFFDPAAKHQLDPFLVAETFDLTPAEARLAVKISQGDTLEQIASRSQVSLATVRSQLKSVFLKTGLKRQADLVRVLTLMPEFMDRFPS